MSVSFSPCQGIRARLATCLLADLKLSLLGDHQLDNAAAAIAAADVLKGQGWQSITQDSLLTGLQHTTLPGRMQVSCALCLLGSCGQLLAVHRIGCVTVMLPACSMQCDMMGPCSAIVARLPVMTKCSSESAL